MAVLTTYTQQPADRLDYDVYYAASPDGTPDFLEPGDSVASITTSVSPADLIISGVLVTPRVKLWVEGGVTGVTYKITITATTTLGRVKQDEIKIKVREL